VKSPLFNNLLILGIGLMGGSLGLAVREKGLAARVTGWSRRESTLEKAIELGVIESFSTNLDAALADADCVVIATPTQLTEKLIVEVVGKVDTTTIVTDVASVKGNLANALRVNTGSVPQNVVLGHPICGSEQSGVTAANVDLYKGQKVVLINEEVTAADNLQRVQALWQALGAEVRLMSLAQHDRILALTSHLPHMLAYALMNQLGKESDECDVFQLSGGGFRDFTRIAGSDPLMWREIALANADSLMAAINNFQDELEKLKKAIAESKGDELEALFGSAQKLRQQKIK